MSLGKAVRYLVLPCVVLFLPMNAWAENNYNEITPLPEFFCWHHAYYPEYNQYTGDLWLTEEESEALFVSTCEYVARNGIPDGPEDDGDGEYDDHKIVKGEYFPITASDLVNWVGHFGEAYRAGFLSDEWAALNEVPGAPEIPQHFCCHIRDAAAYQSTDRHIKYNGKVFSENWRADNVGLRGAQSLNGTDIGLGVDDGFYLPILEVSSADWAFLLTSLPNPRGNTPSYHSYYTGRFYQFLHDNPAPPAVGAPVIASYTDISTIPCHRPLAAAGAYLNLREMFKFSAYPYATTTLTDSYPHLVPTGIGCGNISAAPGGFTDVDYAELYTWQETIVNTENKGYMYLLDQDIMDDIVEGTPDLYDPDDPNTVGLDDVDPYWTSYFWYGYYNRIAYLIQGWHWKIKEPDGLASLPACGIMEQKQQCKGMNFSWKRPYPEDSYDFASHYSMTNPTDWPYYTPAPSHPQPYQGSGGLYDGRNDLFGLCIWKETSTDSHPYGFAPEAQVRCARPGYTEQQID